MAGLRATVQEDPRESPLKLRLGKLAQSVSRMGYIGAALVAFADLFNAIVLANSGNAGAILGVLHSPQQLVGHLIHAVTLSISVIVVAIPEGLPLMITIVLSSNMKRMLRDNVLVRKLVGIETSGNLNILFADKTGTITKGELKVLFFIAGDGKRLDDFSKMRKTKLGQLLRISSAYNTGRQAYRRRESAGRGAATPPSGLCWNSPQGISRCGENVSVVASVPFSSVP